MNRILITGAASGIGRATARLFHRNGWQVGITDIDDNALQKLAAELEGCWHRALNVTDDVACQFACREFCGDHALDALFNSAGILTTGHFEKIDAAAHKRVIDINVTGLMNMTLAAHPYLSRSPHSAVINMSSASALYGTPHMASYSASKFAVRALTEALNIEWGRQGIRVVDIMPPFVKTPMVANVGFQAPVIDRLKVNLSPQEVANMVWKAATQTVPVHNPVGNMFKLMKLLDKVLPSRSTKLTMQFLSRED